MNSSMLLPWRGLRGAIAKFWITKQGKRRETRIALLAQRDALRRECGRWIAQVKRLHVEQRINEPWHEWAPKAFGWSYAIIKRRIRDAAYPDPSEPRVAAQQERDADVKVMQQHSAIAAAWNVDALAPPNISVVNSPNRQHGCFGENRTPSS